MTPRARKLTIAAMVLVTGVTLFLLVTPRDEHPLIGVRFLRYEDENRTAVLQISNHSSSMVSYRFSKNAKPVSGVISGWQVWELRTSIEMPVNFGNRRSSFISVLYKPISDPSPPPIRLRVVRLLRRIGIHVRLTERPGEVQVALPPPSP